MVTMVQDKVSYLPTVEWEGLQRGYEIPRVYASPALPKGTRRIDLWRDEAYKIRGKVIGVGFDALDDDSGEVVAGTSLPAVTITGSDEMEGMQLPTEENGDLVEPHDFYTLPNTHIRSRTTTYISGESTETFEYELGLWCVQRTAVPTAEPVRLTEWYMNGPDMGIIYPRSMIRKLTEEYEKRPMGSDGVYPGISLKHEHHCGYAIIQHGDRRFIIFEVPKGCGPAWSRNLGIEYRPEWGGIPSDDEREAISEIVSFVVGRRLLHIGHTTFDSSGWPIDEVSYNPWGDNVMALCGRHDRSPIKLDPFAERRRLEVVLQQVVLPYLALRDELGLKDALWRYWLSRESTSGIDLPIISAAVETLAGKWLKSNKSQTQGVYLPKEQYDAIVRDSFAAISQQLEGVAGKERIMRTLENAYQITGVRAKIDTFFSELGLPIGPAENKTINARHAPAHGASITSDAEFKKILRASDAYHTLFERVMLKLLGYQGAYLDRSTPGWPETPIDRPMAGWLNQ